MTQQATSTLQVSKSYDIGKPASAFIGARMVQVQTYAVRGADYAVAKSSFTLYPPIPLGGFSAVAGSRYPITGTAVHQGQKFYVVPLQRTGTMMQDGAALVRMDGTVFEQPMISGGLIAPDSFSMSPPGGRFEVGEIKDFTGLGGDANFELIYSGITGGNIRILYREYTGNDMARPAFSQELTYEKGAKQIRFRNLLLKVDAATNEEIRFTVVSD